MDRETIIKANVEVHSRMATTYNEIEPQFLPENSNRVTGLLGLLVDRCRARRVLDLGCGTGFILEKLPNTITEAIGVDVTQAMLDQVRPRTDLRLILNCGDAESFRLDEPADLVTAYSFLHHTHDFSAIIASASENLRSGGIFYADQDPNFYFWDAIKSLDRKQAYHPMIMRELQHVYRRSEEIEEEYGVSAHTFDAAEYGKNILGGVREEELKDALEANGFTEIAFSYYWFLGEGYLHRNLTEGTNAETLQIMGVLLQNSLPLSRNLFKYLGVTARKR